MSRPREAKDVFWGSVSLAPPGYANVSAYFIPVITSLPAIERRSACSDDAPHGSNCPLRVCDSGVRSKTSFSYSKVVTSASVCVCMCVGQWGQTGCPRLAVVVQPFALDRCAPIVFPANRLPPPNAYLLQRDEHVGCPPRFHRNNIHNMLTWFDTHTHSRPRAMWWEPSRNQVQSRRSLRLMYRPDQLSAESHIQGCNLLGSACRGRGQGDDEGGGRIEHDAKKKRALHSRFNRKTSFIRSFIIIKEPGKLPYSTLVAPRSENDDQRVKEGAIRYGKGKKKERKKEDVYPLALPFLRPSHKKNAKLNKERRAFRAYTLQIAPSAQSFPFSEKLKQIILVGFCTNTSAQRRQWQLQWRRDKNGLTTTHKCISALAVTNG
ncbi:hypothetical protein QTP88_023298 [Uroleucon formosanum]